MTAYQPRFDRVKIYQGPDLARLAELDESVERAEREVKAITSRPAQTRLLDDKDPETEAREIHALVAAERDAFATEAEGRVVIVHLVPRPRLRWRQLMREHAARPDVEDDKVFGINMETLPDVLLLESIDVEQSTIEGDVGEFLESLSDYDYYDRLFLAAWALNRGSAPADPTRRLLSVSSQT